MKSFIAIFAILLSLSGYGQTVTAANYKTDTAKSNAAIRALQSQYKALPTGGADFVVVSGVIYVKWDKVNARIDSTVKAMSLINNTQMTNNSKTNIRVDSLVVSDSIMNESFAKTMKALQDGVKLTDSQVQIIKLWMDKVKAANL